MRVFEQGSSLKEAREDREYRSLREERMEGFLSSLTDPLENYPELMSIEEACLEKYVPLIRPSMQRFLSFEMKARRPKRILEIGTAVGFSSILMAKNLLEFSDDFHIDTIENFNVRIPEAEANFKACGVEDYITLHFGDAGEILRLKNTFNSSTKVTGRETINPASRISASRSTSVPSNSIRRSL